MRLNQDCVRDVMLFIENKQVYGRRLNIDDFLNDQTLAKKYSSADICYTLMVLNTTNYLDARMSMADNQLVSCSVSLITWEGHKFLDSIRDPKIWQKTKSIASKLESVSITMLSSIASDVIEHYIDKLLP